MIVGVDGPAVVLTARVCAWLERHADLGTLRVRARGVDAEVSAALTAIRGAGLLWAEHVADVDEKTATRTATEDDNGAQPAPGSFVGTGMAAELAGVSPQAIRKAIADGRLPASKAGDRYRIQTTDLAQYRAARAA